MTRQHETARPETTTARPDTTSPAPAHSALRVRTSLKAGTDPLRLLAMVAHRR